MKNKKLLILIPALMLTFGGLSTLVSCGPSGGDPGEQDVKVTSVTLNKTELSLEVGASEKLEATIAPDNATNKGLTWTVAPEGVATVSALGKVTAGQTPGECVVTATAKDGSGKSASCAVTVTAVDNHGKSETDPLSVADALVKAKALADGATGSDVWYVAGKVKTINYTYSASQGATFEIVDELSDSETVKVFKVKQDADLLQNALKEEASVLVKGKLQNYVKNNTHTYELVGSETELVVISMTGGKADEPEPESHATAATIADIMNDTREDAKVIYDLTADATIVDWRDGTEAVVSAPTAYGNAHLTDGTTEVYAYGMTATASAISWSGAKGTYSMTNPQDFLTNNTTKVLNLGATLKISAIRTSHNNVKQLNVIITEVVNNPIPELESFTLGPANAQVKEGKTLTLTVTPNAGVTVALTDFTWTSSDPSVASVEDGVVTGVAHSDSPVTITATHKEKTSITNTLQVTCVEDSGGGGETYQNATMAKGTGSVYDDTVVVVGGENINCIKVGTSSKGGNLTITVPSTATKVRFYAAAWKSKPATANVSATNATVDQASLSLTADTGVSNSSPFTLAGDAASYLFELNLSNVTGEVVITIGTADGGNARFIAWGAQYC